MVNYNDYYNKKERFAWLKFDRKIKNATKSYYSTSIRKYTRYFHYFKLHRLLNK